MSDPGERIDQLLGLLPTGEVVTSRGISRSKGWPASGILGGRGDGHTAPPASFPGLAPHSGDG